MKIETTYVGTLNGTYGMFCGFQPEGLVVEDVRQILFPEEGYELQKGSQRFKFVWLKDGDVQSNYTEVEVRHSDSGIYTDDKSIKVNAAGTVETVAVVNSRDSSDVVKVWNGTKSQYSGVGTPDQHTIYNIIDDDQRANIDLSNLSATGTAKFQSPISDLSTIRSGASAGATAVQPASLAAVATSGSYTDLSNKPTIPAAQINSDWNASSGVSQILNKPTIPTVNNATLTIQKNGTTVNTFTANASSNVTCNITVPTTAADVSAEPAISLTASRALVSNSSGKVAVSSITSTKLGYLTDVTSNIQAQLDSKAKIQLVNALPASPETGVLYCIPEA